jgi:hypothetical protein
MPPTIQWYVRTALLYLLASMVLGVLVQLDQWRGWFGWSRYAITVHAHLALMGGVIQMIMGVALWMFPLTVPIDKRLQFKEGLAWTTYALFNGGLIARFFVETAFRSGGGDLYGALTLLTSVMQLSAMLVFVFHLWSLRLSRRAQRVQSGPPSSA